MQGKSYIPLKINSAGVMPVILASALLYNLSDVIRSYWEYKIYRSSKIFCRQLSWKRKLTFLPWTFSLALDCAHN
ncbi:hypothetical protein ACEW7V_02470 [Areca yellow leaf disease phytoplasma]|uniref:hypothetical protein n=1 Tax=Areca yellow leaf disease phytoplasma TaxID=927614 RepID=UPI0035B557AB